MSVSLRRVDRACLALLLVLAVALAGAGAVPMVDHTTHRVLEMVDPIPWPQALRPFWNPEPMLAWALRPLSVVLVKLYADLWGPHVLPPIPLMRAKILLSVLAYGLSARAFLRAWGFGRSASLASIGVVVLAPNLFSMVLLPEMDTLGASATLAGGALLARRGPLGWRWGLAVPLVAFALFLKESSGLVQFAFLIAGAMVAWARGHRTRALRHAALVVAGAGVWAWLVSGTLQPGAESMVRGASWLDRLPIAEHNSAQVFAFLGVPGVALLTLGAALPGLRRWGAAGVGGAVAATLLLMVCLPPLVWHDHFAALYFAPRALVSGAGLVMWGALAVAAWRDPVGGRIVALSVAGPVAAITLALLVAASPREDLASRLMLASAPLLHALAWRAAAALWAGAAGRAWARVAVAALAASFAWWPASWGFDYLSELRAAMRVDGPMRSDLATRDLQDGVVAFNHMVLWVAAPELRAVGAPPTLADRTRFAQIPDWLVTDAFPEADWGEGRLPLEALWRAGTPMWLVWAAARPDGLDPAIRARREGDLSWTRRDVGIFTPLNFAPGEHAFDHMIRETMPPHNRIEDARWTRWRPGPTPLQALGGARGEQVWARREGFIRLPTELADVPRRLVGGMPLVERWAFEATVTRLTPPP